MAVALDKVTVASPGMTVCCQHPICGNPATGIMMPYKAFFCEEHAQEMESSDFRRFAEGRSLAQMLHLTEVEIERPAADADKGPVQDRSKTSP